MTYVRDEAFEMFIEEFGEASHRRDVPAEVIERFRGRLPDRLLSYWQHEGWCGYADGRFWTVNPEDYADLLAFWLEGSGLERIDSFHVVARTAFGDLRLFGEKNVLAIQRDAELANRGWNVEHILEKGASKPYLKALDPAGVNYHIGPKI